MKYIKKFEGVKDSIIYNDDDFHVTYSTVEYREDQDFYSGTLEFHVGDWDDEDTYSKVENWIEYSHEKWGFDNWYDQELTLKIKKFLRMEIERCDLENAANKYNL